MDDLIKNNSQNETMINSLNLANDMITKGYLEKLEYGRIAGLTTEDKDIVLDNCARFFNLTKLVINKKEKFVEQLTTIAKVAHATDGSMVNIIKSNGLKMEFYMGVVAKENRGIDQNSKFKTKSTLDAFDGALVGNLAGSDLLPISTEKLLDVQKELFDVADKTICSVSGIPAFRDKNQDELLTYAQGIEHMIDAMRGQKYAIISIADPINNHEIAQMRQGYELIYSQLATFLRNEITINETNTYSLSDTQTKTITDSITKGIALTQSKTKTDGKFSAINAGVGLSFIASINFGASTGVNSSWSDSRGETKSESETSAIGASNALSASAGKSTGNSIQLSYENRTVKSLLEKIDKHLERLDLCESFGAFECATYVVSEERSVAYSAASNFNAIIRGEESSIQASYINTWYKKDDANQISEYLKYFTHPKVYLDKQYQSNLNNKLLFTPASVMTGKEATLLMGLPRQSVYGVPVLEMTPFGRNIEQKHYTGKNIALGKLQHMSKDEVTDVVLDCQSLASHTFITGSTGSGKSNTIYKIIEEISKEQIKFLVIEPAKGEYKHVFGNRDDISVFGTNSKKAPMLKINPFRFPADIHVLEHIDRLIEIFNVCWPMYAAMPAVLKDAVERAYIAAGWNLETSINCFDATLYPAFIDVLTQLNVVINESDFSQELKSNYIGALVTRVKSLTNGINGQIFVTDEIDNTVLFDGNTIVDLSRVASPETKAMIMGILIMRLQEYRIAEGGINRKLRHITVLEEAHNLLKRTSTEQSGEGANLLGKSVEMLANSIAEMRTYGEGFIIADQSPNMLDLSAIRNTNTKIILRLPDLADRELVGHAAGLNNDQINELAKLNTGVAAVYQNNWLEPVLCHINKYETSESEYDYSGKIQPIDDHLKLDVIACLLSHVIKDNIDYNIDSLRERVINSKLGIKVKTDILNAFTYCESINFELIAPAIYGLFDKNDMLSNGDRSKTIDEWNNTIIKNSDFQLQDMDAKFQDLVLFCIVSERYKNTDAERLDTWIKHMGGRLF
jgi:hypothetical protein